jgi:glutamate racemase
VVFADTCIGGSTVAARLARTRRGLRAFFLADYAVNPLGVKTMGEVRLALDRWVDFAHGRSNTLIVACNTASVLLRNAPGVVERASGMGMTVHSMADFLEALLRNRPSSVKGRAVCLMGTEFTVGQSLYATLLQERGARTLLPLPATRTERAIAHLRHDTPEERESILAEIGGPIGESDAVVLACTCFPLVESLIRDLRPGVELLDPAGGVDDLALDAKGEGPNRLTVALTGGALAPEEVEARAATLFPGWELEEVVRL